ncbi:CAP domain-containing protein [Mycolicibacterium sp. lyk4-40-TYG-92]|uniref:CAP domain-containing protein n=1 Tax=Mycolicibacterium sp. lyk4-40-TYG-92 TaxID=3040295 RepID=UPI00254F1134|nr:CAP domain-containing protein [Mycolicibacterium sp. lyk4-40-TYG-92]
MVSGAVWLGSIVDAPSTHADNTRLNDSVVANVYTVQHQAGCTTDIRRDPALTQAAEWRANDILNDRSPDAYLGSGGSTTQSRAAAAGFQGAVAQTVAINPALAINNLDVINQWYYDPADFAIMSNCANTAIGVWSVNSLDRSVLVAVYGQPAKRPA